jgi:hypothetical protein
MDRKAKKKLETLRKKLQILKQRLAGAKKQPDDPSDIDRLGAEVAKIEGEIERLKEAG